MSTIHLNPGDVPAVLAGATDYKGRKWKLEIANELTIRDAAWDGGSRSYYWAINMATGEGRLLSVSAGNPVVGPASVTFKIESNWAVLRHSYFRGKDMGITIYVCEENAAKLLPAPCELTEDEKVVLAATRGLKASYNGKNRFEMVNEYKAVISREAWDKASEALKERKLLNKRGAITVAGRNAIGDHKAGRF